MPHRKTQFFVVKQIDMSNAWREKEPTKTIRGVETRRQNQFWIENTKTKAILDGKADRHNQFFMEEIRDRRYSGWEWRNQPT